MKTVDRISYTLEEIMHEISSRIDLLELIYMKVTSTRIRNLSMEYLGSNFNVMRNRAPIWHITHFRNNRNPNGGTIRAVREEGNIVKAFNFSHFGIHVNELEAITLVSVWRSILIFRLASGGFIVLNLCTGGGYRIQFPQVMRMNDHEAYLGLKVCEDPRNHLHYVLTYVHREGENLIQFVHHSLPLENQNQNVGWFRTNSTLVAQLTDQESLHPMAMVIPTTAPPTTVCISIRENLPVHVSQEHELLRAEAFLAVNPPLQPQQLRLYYCNQGYMMAVVMNPNFGVHVRLQRAVLFYYRPNGGGYEYISEAPVHALPNENPALPLRKFLLGVTGELVHFSVVVGPLRGNVQNRNYWRHVTVRYNLETGEWSQAGFQELWAGNFASCVHHTRFGAMPN